MDTHFASRSICICLGLTLALPLAAQFETSAVIQYTAERISLGFTPEAMNNRGWIVGQSISSKLPMRYRPGVGTEQISNLPGRLYDINDAGTAVGVLWLDGHNEAIIRPAGSPWKRIGTLGAASSSARAINEAGQVVGYFGTDSRADRPFIYTEAEGMRMLFDQPAGPVGINEAGQVAGQLFTGSWEGGFLWDPVQGLIDINAWAGVSQLVAVGIADDGTVASKYSGARQRLATFSLINGVRGIGERYNQLLPKAVNKRGWVVGGARAESWRAFLYVYGQGIRDLNELLVTPLDKPLTYGHAINDRDEILANSSNPTRFYLLRRVR